MSSSRQLAAIMFTDIVGYTALMGNDEQKAFELLKKNRAIHKPLIKQFHGTWIKELGDGVLASFPAVTNAVYCAAAIHQACAAVEGLKLRIGIHLGEVIFENNDVFGDGVNIASRLQAIAPAGRTWASETVYKTLVNKKEISAEFVKEETLKNVGEPVKVYEISVKEIPNPLPRSANGYPRRRVVGRFHGKNIVYVAAAVILIILTGAYFLFLNKQTVQGKQDNQAPEKSIAVLPFVNMSDEKDQEYFSDGLSEELLNLLSKIPELKVIGRTSSFAFKGKNEDLRSIAEKLRVAHLLEGSVRKDGNKIRVTTQLIKAADGSHLWSETYDRDLKGVFQLQDEIAQAVVQQLKLKLLDVPSAKISGAGNIEAYNLLLQGNYFFDKLDKENVDKAVDLYKQAILIDSTNARAWEKLSDAVSRQAWQKYINNDSGREQAKQASLKAIALDKNLAAAYEQLGDHYLYFEFDWRAAEENYLKAVKLEPDNPQVLYGLGGDLYFHTGRWEDAIKNMKRCIELDPLKPLNHLNLGNILSYKGRLEEAKAYFKKALDLNPQFQRAHLYLGRNYLLEGKPDLALKEMQEESLEVFRIFGLGLAYYALGKKKEADEMLTIFTQKFQNEWNYLAAELYGFRGENEKALIWLENAYQNKDSWLVFIKGDPLMKNLKSDSRFISFLNKINLDFE